MSFDTRREEVREGLNLDTTRLHERLIQLKSELLPEEEHSQNPSLIMNYFLVVKQKIAQQRGLPIDSTWDEIFPSSRGRYIGLNAVELGHSPFVSLAEMVKLRKDTAKALGIKSSTMPAIRWERYKEDFKLN